MKRLASLVIILAAASPAYASSSSVLLTGSNTGGVVNGVQVLGATTGNPPVVSSQGSDTNVGLILTTQGSGALNLETAGAGNVILAPGSGNVTIPTFTTSGIVLNNASGVLSSGTALPNGTTATTQSSGDNSTKVATTAYVDSATGGSGGMVLLATVNASGAANASFGSSYITGTYNCYKVIGDSVLPSTNGATLMLQVSPNNGSTIETSGYQWGASGGNSGGGYYLYSASDTSINMSGQRGVYNTATLTDQFEVTFCNPSSTNITTFRWSVADFDQTGGSNTLQNLNGAGAWNTAGAINYVVFSFSSGNITGKFHLYGLSGT